MPYILGLFLIAIPMYSVETAFGQCYTQETYSMRYSTTSRRFLGYTYAQLLVSMLTNLYYVVLMAWSFSYLFLSF